MRYLIRYTKLEVKNKKFLFISIKPEFANKIVSEEKTIELRKVKPKVSEGDYIVIYASSPIKSVIGYGKVKEVIVTSPETMWDKYSSTLGIDKQRYDSYFQGCDKAIGIKISEISRINPIALDKLRKIDTDFHPPQIYRYVSNINICRSILKFLQ